MHVLVVGGTRFMGRRLVWRLLAGGHRVTLFNRGTRDDGFGARVERLRGDRRDDDFRRLLSGRSFDAAVDFAAYRGVDAERVVEVLGDRLGHYVLISTGQVYLVREGCPSPARESDDAGPLLAEPEDAADREDWEYGMGKRACEDVLAAAWSARRFPATRLRLPIVNGEADPSRRLEGYLWRLLDGGPLLLPDGGAKRVRQVYAGEVARLIVELLCREHSFGEAYNVCQDESPSLRELVERLASCLGARPRVVSVPEREIEAAGLVVAEVAPFSGRWTSFLDPTKARRELAFRHESLDGYLGKIVAGWIAHMPSEPPQGCRQRDRERVLARAWSRAE